MFFHYKCIYVILFCLCFCNVYSQFVHVSKYSNPALNSTRAIVKDGSGFVWLTSQSGSFRYDGENIKKIPYGKSADSLSFLGSSSILCFNNSKHELLTTYTKAGLAVLNYGLTSTFFQLLNIAEVSTDAPVLAVENLGDEYLVANSDGLYLVSVTKNTNSGLYSSKVIQFLPVKNTIAACKTSVTAFAVLSGNNVISAFEKNKDGRYKMTSNATLDFIEKNTEIYTFKENNKNYLIGSSKGLYQFSFFKNLVSNLGQYIPEQSVYAVCTVYDSTVYVAGSKKLYLLNKAKRLTEITSGNFSRNENFLSTVYNIFSDSNRIWIASQEGLAMFRHEGTPFYSVKENESFIPNHIYQINKNKSEKIMLSSENGLYTYDPGSGIAVNRKEDTYFLSMQAPDGNQIVSSINHTYVQDRNDLLSIEKIYPEFEGFENLSFNDFEYLDTGRIILSTENESGVYIWDQRGKKIKRLESLLGISERINQTNNLYKDSGAVFILTDNDLWEYSGNLLKKNTLKNKLKPYGILFDMVRVKSKYFFTSYDNGVIETDNKFNVQRVFNTSTGLSDNGVYRIHSFEDSLLMVSSNNGLNCINIHSGKIKVFTEEDGLHSNVFEEFSSFAINGKIYFGGKSGFTIVDPGKINFSLNEENNLQLMECKTVDNRNVVTSIELFGLNKLTFPNNTSQITISFRNLIYPYNSRIKYAYKITGLHKTWIELGQTGSISLIGLSPGTYHLQVKAANEDGVWSEPKELVLEFLPKWYQTWWFKLLVFLTTAGIIYAFYQYRIRQIKKQHEIRKNIATDLHDDLGSTLNSVKVFTNLAISGVKQEESLQQVKDNLTEATMSLRDMIWVLDDSLDTVDELITRLKQFALPVAAASNIETVIKADSEVNSRQLTKEEKRNLFLICKEAINNSIKYSGAAQIQVDIKPRGKKIQIIIQDNGKGFNADEVKKGYGLKNMQYRAGQIKFKVQLTTAPGSGTQIILLPL